VSLNRIRVQADRGLNLLIGLLCLIVAVLLTQRVLDDSENAPSHQYPEISRIAKECASPNAEGKVLVLVLSEGCQHCTDAAPFFKRIAEALIGTSVRTLAILPQATDQGQRYVDRLGIKVELVKQISSISEEVPGTPAVFVASNRGVVEYLAIGRLDAAEETALSHMLGVSVLTGEPATSKPNGVEDDGDCISAEDLGHRKPQVRTVRSVLLDIRSRDEYKVWHLSGAINIPHDEIEARAPMELNRNGTIVVYSSRPDIKRRAACQILGDRGFPNVSWLCGGIRDWTRSGLRIDGNSTAGLAIEERQTQQGGNSDHLKISRIAVSRVKGLLRNNAAIIVDIRSVEDFGKSHIEGAISLPLTQIVAGRYDSLPRDKRLISYCACPSEQSSAKAAVLLTRAGYRNPAALLGGIDAWEASGGRVVP
jgi:rhodanese-related sulfurtransferase